MMPSYENVNKFEMVNVTEKIHSQSNYYFSQSELVTLTSKCFIPWQSKNYKYNKERFTKSSVK